MSSSDGLSLRRFVRPLVGETDRVGVGRVGQSDVVHVGVELEGDLVRPDACGK